MTSFTMIVLPKHYAVCQLPADAAAPDWATQGELFCLMRSPEELSIVCEEWLVPEQGVIIERGWRALKLQGPFAFELTGVLTAVLNPLADAAIGIFALSTYNTDYVLVKQDQLDPAIEALRAAGHQIVAESTRSS
ncbi:MAG: ACT domain-containing protein [Chloroflexi bacterium]|nr:ACT domain-containing protein [Chloroflexota bacterium]